MPSDIYVKKSTGWSTAVTSIKAKTSSGWSTAAKFVYARINAGWTRVWPLSGVYPNTNPFISNNTTTTSEISYGTVLRVGNTHKGDRGSWNANGFTISSYDYKWLAYVNDTSTSTNYTQDFQSLTTQTNSLTITGTSAANFDKGWISFVVRANASNSAYSGTAGSLRYYVVRQRPRIASGGTPSFNITSPKIGNTISYSSSWDTTDAYKPEAARTTIFWYKNSTATTTGGTLVQTGGYSYVVQSTDLGSYIYVIETSFNSGSDYDLGSTVGISATAITSSAVTAAIAAPTISSITASGIGGPVSVSFAGGSGPFYQMFWWGTATAPTGLTTPDASGSASPLTDNTGPTSTATQYMYVRSVTTQSDTGVANATTISPWSAGVSFNMTSASALTPTFGTNTSTANGFTGSVTNYDSAYNWNTPSNGSFTLTNGTWTWAIASGATRSFTVTGLSASQSSTATVTTTRSDYASGSASTTGTASALPKYTVTWGANGGTGGGSTGPFDAGTSHTAPSPGTRDGFDFTNYRYPASGGTDPVFVLSGGSYTPTADTTFGAQWTAKTYAVTFNANGGTGAPAGQTKIHGTTLTLSSTAPTRATVGSTQYTFAGWNTAADGTGTSYSAGASYTLNAALSLFAQWTVTTLNWSISWNANGGTGGGTTTQPRGNSHTAPSPGTRSGFTFSQWRKPEFGGDPTFVANNGTFTPTAADAFWAQWTANPVPPSGGTVSISTNTGNYNVGSIITYSTSGWANTPTSYSLRLYNGTNPVLTSDPLRASTSSASGTYTIQAGDIPNYFKAFATASNSAGASTEASSVQVGPAVSSFVTPTCGPPQISSNQLGFVRSGTSVTWYSDYPTPQGNYSYIIGMEWQVRTTNSTTTTPLNTGTYAGGGSGDGLQGNTTKYMTYPVSTAYPYSAAGTIWAFRIKSTENTAATSSSRFARARVIMMGTNGTVYFGTWSTNI